MPHILFYYEEKFASQIDLEILFKKLHKKLSDILETDIELFQSRLIPSNKVFVGLGSLYTSILVEILLLEGRAKTKKQNAINATEEIIKIAIKNIDANVLISINITDLKKDFYIRKKL